MEIRAKSKNTTFQNPISSPDCPFKRLIQSNRRTVSSSMTDSIRLDPSPPLLCFNICHLPLIYSRFEKTQKFIIKSTPIDRPYTHTHVRTSRQRTSTMATSVPLCATPPSRPLMSPLARCRDEGSVKIS